MLTSPVPAVPSLPTSTQETLAKVGTQQVVLRVHRTTLAASILPISDNTRDFATYQYFTFYLSPDEKTGTPPVDTTPPTTTTPVVTGDIFTAKTFTPGIDAKMTAILVNAKDKSFLDTIAQPTISRKAGTEYTVKWNGEYPAGNLLPLSAAVNYEVQMILSRVISKPGWGVGNTSDNADNNMLSAFAQSTVFMETEDKIYRVDPFNEMKPWFCWTYKNEQKWKEVLGADWFTGTYTAPGNQNGFDIPVRYYEGGRHLRQDSTYIYLALVHTGQDRLFNSGIIRIRKSDHALVPFTAGENLVFGNSGTYDQNVRTGVLSARRNSAPFTDASSTAVRRSLSKQTRISGLAVSDTYIMVARAGINEITVYQNNLAGTYVATITTVVTPGAIDIASNGQVVVVTNGAVKSYTFNGTSFIATNVSYLSSFPMYVSCAKSKDEICVMQGGVTQQTIFFKADGTKLSKVWGKIGGKVTNTNIDVALDEFMHICMSKLALDAVDREAYGEQGGSVTYAVDDSSLWQTDWGHARALNVNSSDLSYKKQIAHIYDFLSLCVNPKDPSEVISNHLGFFVTQGAITGGDHMSLPAAQRGQYLVRNYAAGQNVSTWGLPRCMTTLVAGTKLKNGTVLTDTYTYLLIPDASIQREPGRPYCRLVERYNSVLRDTGIVAVAYGNGGEDTTLDASGTLYRPVNDTANNKFQIAITQLLGVDANRNPIYAAETLTPATTYGPKDPWPTKPYWGDSPTRIREAPNGMLFISQVLRRQDQIGSFHMAYIDPLTGQYWRKFWKGSNTDGLTGRLEYPEANNAFNAGTTGANADIAGRVAVGCYNGQREGEGSNTHVVFIDGFPAHEWSVLDGGGSGLSFLLSAAGNIMDTQLQMIDNDTYREWFSDESDGSKLHARVYTGFASTVIHTFKAEDVYDTTPPVYGKNIFDVSNPGVTTGVLIRGDYGGAQGGTPGYTGTTNFIPVSAAQYSSNKDLSASAWYSAANEGSWLRQSFKDTKGKRPDAAKFLRVSDTSDLKTLMILEGEEVPATGYIPYNQTTVGAVSTPTTTPTPTGPNYSDATRYASLMNGSYGFSPSSTVSVFSPTDYAQFSELITPGDILYFPGVSGTPSFTWPSGAGLQAQNSTSVIVTFAEGTSIAALGLPNDVAFQLYRQKAASSTSGNMAATMTETF